MHCDIYSSISEIPESTWNDLFSSHNPFVQHAFLLAMEQSGCVSAKTGWLPRHLVLKDGDKVLAALPLYAKSNSYGEFVFDWGWAEAYQRHGLAYYPKLVTAVPFSPVEGPRVGIADSADPANIIGYLTNAIHQLAASEGYSGWHLLFPGQRLQQVLSQLHDEGAFLHREAVQFHWFNRGYQSFDDFLMTLRSSRRKNVKRERRLVKEAGIDISRVAGVDISDQEWQGFFQCYQSTYLKRSGHPGYLNLKFFAQLRETLAESLMLVVARRNADIVACSLFLHDKKRLYGRYWGALEDVSCLHFEACFYQGIEYCIENGIQRFDPGTQGEHKLVRGFEPVKTASYHWIANGDFQQAIADFLHQEKRHTDDYQQQAEEMLPFKKNGN